MIKDIVSLSYKHQFYGRRKAYRLSLQRQKLLDTLLPKLIIDLDESKTLIPTELFKKSSKVWLEIGFGAGEHLVAQAEKYPDINFIGCEPYINGVAKLLSEIKEKSITNIRIYNDDARFLLEKLAPNSIDKVFILFSDPWPKKRHSQRRFINSENLDVLSTVMKSAGKLRFSTDDMYFVRWSLDIFYRHPEFEWLVEGPNDWKDRYSDSIPTRYEKKAIKLGKSCVYLTFRRHDRNLL